LVQFRTETLFVITKSLWLQINLAAKAISLLLLSAIEVFSIYESISEFGVSMEKRKSCRGFGL